MGGSFLVGGSSKCHVFEDGKRLVFTRNSKKPIQLREEGVTRRRERERERKGKGRETERKRQRERERDRRERKRDRKKKGRKRERGEKRNTCVCIFVYMEIYYDWPFNEFGFYF